jgi:hypothetical protein
MTIEKRIAIVGANLSGRSTLGRALATRFLLNPVKSIATDTGHGRRFEIRGTTEHIPVVLCGLTGPSFFLERSLREVLAGAQLVMMVLGTPYADEFEIDLTRQRDTISTIMSVALDTRKTWREIPWILVVNKCDLGHLEPTRLIDVDDTVPCFRVTARKPATTDPLISYVRRWLRVEAKKV